MSKAYVVNESAPPLEGWDDLARGTCMWRTMISADVAPTNTFSTGIAYFAPGATLAPHLHSHPEVYFVLEGELEVTIAGVKHCVTPNTSLFIPGNTVHELFNAALEPARLYYCFATDRFSDVVYQFPYPAKPEPAPNQGLVAL
ncbi:MAG: cupin domain-containing protein [Alphaproteobacteria bacterium]|nr:cupin domain-containing protein [Alphaproteobacteria bacterium]